MRVVGLFSILLCIAAIILSFLCIFAGKGILIGPTFSIISLNSSRVGENILRQTLASFSGDKQKLDNVLNSLIRAVVGSHLGSSKTRRDLEERGIIDTLTNGFNLITDPTSLVTAAEGVLDELQQRVGLEDFYDFHVRYICSGQFTPVEVPNATFTADMIDRNVTKCTGYSSWKPSDSVQRILNQTRLNEAGVTLDTINWPQDLDDKIKLAETILKVTMWLYVVTIILAFLVVIASLILLFSHAGRHPLLGSFISIMAILGFLIVAVASAITTVAAVQLTKAVKNSADSVGLDASSGAGFMGLTWACAGCLFIASILGCVGCCGARRQKDIDHKYG